MKKIMMVEDNEDHAFLIRCGIENSDCEIKHFLNGQQAVDACKTMTRVDELPQLVLLDMKLPGLNGIEVLQELRKMKLFSAVPIVMLSTSNRKEEVLRSYELGANSYVVKSQDFDELTEKLRKIKEYWFNVVEVPGV